MAARGTNRLWSHGWYIARFFEHPHRREFSNQPQHGWEDCQRPVERNLVPGDGKGRTRIQGGIYENRYALTDAGWRISLLNY